MRTILYRGYLRVNGKHSSIQFKSGQKLLKFEIVRKEDSYVLMLRQESKKLLTILDNLNVEF